MPEIQVQMDLTQIPVIKHDLQNVGIQLKNIVDELNIDAQVATEDTLKSLKEKRTYLNKLSQECESQRKEIKKRVLAPYDLLEESYKTNVKEIVDPAIAKLGSLISSVETKLVEERTTLLKEYFDELKLSYGEKIDWLKFPQIKIIISDSIKKQKENIQEFVEKVIGDLTIISTENEDSQAEILVEYKNTLDASKSIITVRNRRAEKKAESERILIKRTEKRESELRGLAFFFNQNTMAFSCATDESLSISQKEIESLNNEEFSKKIEEFRVKLKTKKEVLQAPKVEEKPEIKQEPKVIKITFEVSGTVEQLTKMNEYLKTSGLTYKQL